MPPKLITPKVIDYTKDYDFLGLLKEVRISLNYLEQYHGKLFEDSDFLPPLYHSKMEVIKGYLQSALNHIKIMEDKGIIFT